MRTGVAIQTSNYDWDNVHLLVDIISFGCSMVVVSCRAIHFIVLFIGTLTFFQQISR